MTLGFLEFASGMAAVEVCISVAANFWISLRAMLVSLFSWWESRFFASFSELEGVDGRIRVSWI